MILHVVRDEFDWSILCWVNHALALTEENGWLQVSNFLRLWTSWANACVALVEEFLEACNLTILSIEVVAQTVDDSVQTIDLSLVAEVSNLEVVSTVRVLELVNDTSVQLEVCTVNIELSACTINNWSISILVFPISKNRTIETPSYSWLNVNLPCLFLTKVEGEVKTSFCCSVINVIIAVSWSCTELMSPSKTSNSYNF